MLAVDGSARKAGNSWLEQSMLAEAISTLRSSVEGDLEASIGRALDKFARLQSKDQSMRGRDLIDVDGATIGQQRMVLMFRRKLTEAVPVGEANRDEVGDGGAAEGCCGHAGRCFQGAVMFCRVNLISLWNIFTEVHG